MASCEELFAALYESQDRIHSRLLECLSLLSKMKGDSTVTTTEEISVAGLGEQIDVVLPLPSTKEADDAVLDEQLHLDAVPDVHPTEDVFIAVPDAHPHFNVVLNEQLHPDATPDAYLYSDVVPHAQLHLVVSGSSIDPDAAFNCSTKCSSGILDAVAPVAPYATSPSPTNIKETLAANPGAQIDHSTTKGLLATKPSAQLRLDVVQGVHLHLITETSLSFALPQASSTLGITCGYVLDISLAAAAYTTILIVRSNIDTEVPANCSLECPSRVGSALASAVLYGFIKDHPADLTNVVATSRTITTITTVPSIISTGMPTMKYILRQPWPPPVQLKNMSGDAKRRPIPWPNFMKSDLGFAHWYFSFAVASMALPFMLCSTDGGHCIGLTWLLVLDSLGVFMSLISFSSLTSVQVILSSEVEQSGKRRQDGISGGCGSRSGTPYISKLSADIISFTSAILETQAMTIRLSVHMVVLGQKGTGIVGNVGKRVTEKQCSIGGLEVASCFIQTCSRLLAYDNTSGPESITQSNYERTRLIVELQIAEPKHEEILCTCVFVCLLLEYSADESTDEVPSQMCAEDIVGFSSEEMPGVSNYGFILMKLPWLLAMLLSVQLSTWLFPYPELTDYCFWSIGLACAYEEHVICHLQVILPLDCCTRVQYGVHKFQLFSCSIFFVVHISQEHTTKQGNRMKHGKKLMASKIICCTDLPHLLANGVDQKLSMGMKCSGVKPGLKNQWQRTNDEIICCTRTQPELIMVCYVRLRTSRTLRRGECYGLGYAIRLAGLMTWADYEVSCGLKTTAREGIEKGQLMEGKGHRSEQNFIPNLRPSSSSGFDLISASKSPALVPLYL